MRLLRKTALWLTGLCLVIALVAAGAFVWMTPRPPVAQLFYNGTILTMDDTVPEAAAVLIVGDTITAVGDEAELAARAPEGTERHDLSGNVLMPGFIDAHGHFPGWGVMAVAVDLNSPPIGEVRTMADIKARIAAKARDIGPGALILGMGYDDTLLAEKRHPTRHDLDEAAPDNPVILNHVSGHMQVGNSVVLATHSITSDAPDPPGGEIIRDAEGVPTGLLKETAGEPLLAQALAFSPPQMLTMLRAGVADYLSKGVTLAQSGYAEASFFAPMGWAARLHLIPLRLSLLVEANHAFARAEHGTLNDFQSDMFHIAGIKLITDGSIQGYTGYLRDPYAVAPKGYDPAYRGYPIYDPETLQGLVDQAYALGIRPYLHGNGDASIDMILDAVEAAQMRHPGRDDLWPVIIHAQMMQPDQMARAVSLKVTPSFFNAHVFYWGDRHVALFMGRERARRMSPMAEAKAAGLPFTLHLDTPVVPMNPWLMVWSAVARETSSGKLLGADQAISVMDALKATTITAAWQIGLADKTGSITPGKWADLIVIDRDPRAAPVETLRDIVVLKTIVGGVERYAKD